MENDLIRRSDAIQAFDELLKSPYANDADSFSCGVRDALKLARDMMRNDAPKSLSIPAVDAVEVCRCGQCKFTETDCVDAIYCQRWDRWEMPSDGYCSWGQRREDGDGDG